MFDGLQIPPKVSPKPHYIKMYKNYNITKKRKTKQTKWTSEK